MGLTYAFRNFSPELTARTPAPAVVADADAPAAATITPETNNRRMVIALPSVLRRQRVVVADAPVVEGEREGEQEG